MKKFFLSIALLSVVALLGGCAAGKQADNQTAGNRGENALASFKLDFPKGAKADLTIGKKISAMGMNETNGVIIASQIVVGMPSGGMGGLWGGPRGMASGTMATGTRFSSGSAPNPQMLRSGGQQQQRTGGFGGNGGSSNNAQNPQRPTRVRSQARANGEIIKIDSNSLVLKADDGGSKVVYFTDKTEIYIFQAPAAPSASSTIK